MTGPVVEYGEFFWLLIPLKDGGKNFVKCAKGVSVVEDGYLKVYIAANVAKGIGIQNGSIVQIDNLNGKLNVRLANANEDITRKPKLRKRKKVAQ
jgi:hypothetical protein